MEYLYISDNEINKGNLRITLCGLILNGVAAHPHSGPHEGWIILRYRTHCWM